MKIEKYISGEFTFHAIALTVADSYEKQGYDVTVTTIAKDEVADENAALASGFVQLQTTDITYKVSGVWKSKPKVRGNGQYIKATDSEITQIKSAVTLVDARKDNQSTTEDGQ